MRKPLVTLAAAGAIGISSVAAVPLMASAATTTPSPSSSSTSTGNPVTDRVNAIKSALAGLVTDKTLTQAQADKVAATLADTLPGRGGPGGRGGGPGADLSVAATALGMTVDELHTALHAGKTLATVAGEEGVSVDTLIDKLVAAAEDRIDQGVADGRLTAAEAATKKADLEERITTMVNEGPPLRGPGGPGARHGGPRGDAGAGGSATAPSSSASASA